jgi:hypothetical protein
MSNNIDQGGLQEEKNLLGIGAQKSPGQGRELDSQQGGVAR